MPDKDHVTVYVADQIRTMQPAMPTAQAVAVRDGMILEVGTVDSLRPWMDDCPHTLDDATFRGKTLMPGFIEPHLHPQMAAIAFQTEIVSAIPWNLPWARHEGILGRDAYLARLAELHAAKTDADATLAVWGYHHGWHGDIDRSDLDAISAARPIIVIHRSFHEAVVNTAFLERYGITPDIEAQTDQVDLAAGRFWETGGYVAMAPWREHATSTTAENMDRVAQAVRAGGITTFADMAFGMAAGSVDNELAVFETVFEQAREPFRVVMVPTANWQFAACGTNEAALASLESLPARSTPRLQFGRRVKLFADGAMFGLRMQLRTPCCGVPARAEWMTEPDELRAQAKLYWKAGFEIHVHVTGDAGVDLVLDIVEDCQEEHYRADHRFTIEHFGLSDDDQIRRIKKLGVQVSANPFYLYELTEYFEQAGIGHERASQMSRLGSLEAAGIPFALHSDLTMAPAEPLLLAWVATNRITINGQVTSPSERVSLDAAMRAITIDAAYILGMEREIGSIACGKRADFTVLDADPWEVGTAGLKDIPIWGTVFDGDVFPAPRSQTG